MAPSADKASARFTAVVDLPTPPLPDATAIMLRTFGRGFKPFCTAWAATFQVTVTCASGAPAAASAATAISRT
ncbi:hypothetical protein D3C87_1908350 [compost metagenome]